MIFHSSAMVVPCRPLCSARLICSASKINPDQLRLQIDQLQSEAESTRAKANSARLRLMRLSEAAEKLKRQAATSVNSGKEDDARQLLFQKKKVMQAMERSKSRIELLDELAAKLNEAISLKESQLIGNIDLDLEAVTTDASGPVRIMSSTLGVVNDSDVDNEHYDSLEHEDSVAVKGGGNAYEDCSNSTNDNINNNNIQLCEDEEADVVVNKDQGSRGEVVFAEHSLVAESNASTYEDFLEHIDLQLSRIEEELVTILNVSSLILNDKEKPNNSKVQQTTELLESICAVRQRIGRILQKV